MSKQLEYLLIRYAKAWEKNDNEGMVAAKTVIERERADAELVAFIAGCATHGMPDEDAPMYIKAFIDRWKRTQILKGKKT